MNKILKSAELYWHTLKHLRPIQLTGRVRYKLARPRPDLSQSPVLKRMKGHWERPAERRQSLSSPGFFLFLGQSGCLCDDGWDNPDRDKLWRYNLHYFDDLNARRSPERRNWHQELIARWIAENPPVAGTGWEPYPTSLRIVNWIKWLASGAVPHEDMVQSLAVQARWLIQKLEWHLLGNHLFANAKALVFAGLYFEGDEADGWLRVGREILFKELPEQILPDGGQFELSPMYHALALEDVLDLINILRAAPRPGNESLITALEDRVEPMIDWLAAMSHPDDQISFFNDAAFGIAPDNSELRAYSQRLGYQPPLAAGDLTYLEDSGYVRLSTGPTVIIADVAEVGPSYLPGHAHADTLSFECSVFGQRLIVNSGTSVYGTGAERLRQRGTAAHSTVVVRDENSSEVWGGFRVARRAHVMSRSCRRDGDMLAVEATHDGYTRLRSGPKHTRRWRLRESGLTIIDEVTPADEAKAIFHIHPDVSVDQETSKSGRMVLGDGRIVKWISETGVEVADGTWHPEFGKSIPNRHLIVPLTSGRSQFDLFWS